MPSKSSSFDASASALGYLYQCRFALLLGLQRASDPSHSISIEKLDDVSFSNVAASGIEDPVKLFQLKHHIKEGGGTSNSSLDVWKSLRVWAKHLRQGKVDLKNCTFVLVTTSQSLPSHAISLLRCETGSRRSEAARAALELAGSKSKNKTVKDCFASLMTLSEKKRKMLFERIVVVDNSFNVQSLTSEIERELWSAVDTRHVSAFVERLEGLVVLE